MKELKRRLTQQLIDNLEKVLRLEPKSFDLDFGSNRSLLIDCAYIIQELANMPDREIVDCPSCRGSGVRPGFDPSLLDGSMRTAMACYDCMGDGRMYLTEDRCLNRSCSKYCPFCKGIGFQLKRVSEK